ncbi:MAG: ATP-binding cassette domain-containing protein [Planctomycetota bacterium]
MGLAVRGLSVRYGRRRVVDGLDLDVPDGAITGFLGHNGAGKTSAMRGILGLNARRAASLTIDGRDGLRAPREVTARVGALIETTAFQPGWSARRNLIELGRLQGLGRAEARGEADRLLEQVGLDDAAGRDPGQFSQGMRQRLGLAQALLGGRRTLLLDEPTNGLDPEGIGELWDLLRELRDRDGAAILLSSHLLGEVEALCDRVVVLREGRRVAAGAMADLREATGNRYAIDVERPDAARAALAAAGIQTPTDGAAFEVDLGPRDPAELLDRLVQSGARPRSFAPASGGLSAVYSAATEGRLELEAATEVDTRKHPDSVPTSSVARLLGFEARRHARLLWLFVTPLLLAGVPVWGLVRKRAAAQAEVDEEALFSSTDVTAFRAAAEGLELGLPLAALVSMLVTSQLLAGELGRGTLRNVALRPLTRLQLSLAKWLTALAIGGLCVASALAGATGFAGLAFEYGDLEEVLVGGQRFPIMTAAEVVPDFRRALTGSVAVTLAFASFGFAAGALVRRGIVAVGLSLALFLFLIVSRWFAAGGDWEWLNPATYLPFLTADASRVHAVAILADGATNVPFEYGTTEFSVPLVLAGLSGLVGLAAITRVRIP